jgi:hypothetical protein
MSHCICGVATAVRGFGDEIGETNVSVGQFNQSSIEILFAICHGPGQLGCFSESSFLPKNRTNLQENHIVWDECLL